MKKNFIFIQKGLLLMWAFLCKKRRSELICMNCIVLYLILWFIKKMIIYSNKVLVFEKIKKKKKVPNKKHLDIEKNIKAHQIILPSLLVLTDIFYYYTKKIKESKLLFSLRTIIIGISIDIVEILNKCIVLLLINE